MFLGRTVIFVVQPSGSGGEHEALKNCDEEILRSFQLQRKRKAVLGVEF